VPRPRAKSGIARHLWGPTTSSPAYYNWEIKEILKALATDESSVNEDDVIEYLGAYTEPLAPEYEATINLWLSRIEGTDQLPTEDATVDPQSNDRTIMTMTPK
jgi:hypothetical protein